jgi:hypothetical protein
MPDARSTNRLASRGLRWLLPTLLMAAGAAGASPVHHLDFQAGANTNTGYTHLSYSLGGANLVVTAWTTAPTPGAPRSGGYGRVTPLMGSVGGESAGIYDGDSGLGVFQAGTDSKNMDGGDGAAEPDEGMMFLFDREVELTVMNFNFWDGRDNYGGLAFGDRIELYVDGAWVMNYGGADDRPTLGLVGSMFVLLATDDQTSVRVQDLDFRVIEVPAPATLGLSGLALAALTATRRRPRALNRA